MSEHIVEIIADGRCYRLDLGRRALFRERDKRVRLTRQQWELLRFFVERPQHTLLTKNELVANVWANGAAVTDDAVSLAVKSLRRVLDDRGGQFIQTEHGQGYRFTADIKRLSEEEAQAPMPTAPAIISAAPAAQAASLRTRASASATHYVEGLIGSFLTPVLEGAVLERDDDLIAALVARGADINTREVSYDSLGLLLVCECEEDEMKTVMETLRTLYRAGHDPNLRDVHGMNILFETTYMDYRAPLTAISLDVGANVNHRDKEGATPLIQAARFVELVNAKILLTAGADPNVVDDEGNSAAISAIDQMRWSGLGDSIDLEDEIITFLTLLENYGAVLDGSLAGCRDAAAIAGEYGYKRVLAWLAERATPGQA